jgi:Transposase DDE domain
VAQSTRTPIARQLKHLRNRFAQQPGLSFADLLPDATPQLLQADTDDPIYTPLVTLGLFLGQVLDPNGSCRHAVARLLAWRTAQGQSPCSANTGAYCKARQRLPEEGLHTLTRHAGTTLASRAPRRWLWKQRRVQVADGTTVNTPDTPANQRVYPQTDGQKPGLGFPIIRLVVLFCLATGAVLEAALAPYRGKGTGELSLLRQVWHSLEPGDVLLGDRIFCSYFEIALLHQRGVDVVLHKHQSRRTDFRTGRRLGRCDHQIHWQRPVRADWMDEATYQKLPATLALREVRVEVSVRGFRVWRYELITTLTDWQQYRACELGQLYRRRWEAELHLRAVKTSMGMDQLSCKSPELVRKELWVYLLGYNLVRGVMAEGAAVAGLAPRNLSFAGAMQSVRAFGELLSGESGGSVWEGWRRLWMVVGSHRVGNRPDRVEPRAIKRRKKDFPPLTQPRNRAPQRHLQSA